MYVVEYFDIIEDGAAAWTFSGIFVTEGGAEDALAKECREQFKRAWSSEPPTEAWPAHHEHFFKAYRIREIPVGELLPYED